MEFGHKKRTLKPSPKPLTILFASRFTSFGTFLDTMDEKSRDYDHSTEIEAPGHLVRKSNPHHTATLSGRATSLGFPDDSVRVGNKTKISGSLLALRKRVKSIEEHFGGRTRLRSPGQTPLPGEVSACYSKIIIYYRPTTLTTERFQRFRRAFRSDLWVYAPRESQSECSHTTIVAIFLETEFLLEFGSTRAAPEPRKRRDKSPVPEQAQPSCSLTSWPLPPRDSHPPG